MRTLKLLAMAALAASTTACVETVDQGYGYSDGYYAPSQGYYSQPAYYAPATTYYAPTQVVTQTRYVPVPVAVPQHTFTPQAQARTQSNGHEHDRPQATNTPAPQQPAVTNQHRGNGHDRNDDGRPDRNN